MKPLIVLIVTFVIVWPIIFLFQKEWDFILAGNIAICIMLCFTAIGHFKFKKGMTMMMPGFIPFKSAFVFLTGVFEILAGILLLFPQYRTTLGWVLIVFLLLLLPANVNAAIKKVDYEKGTFKGKGTEYLWFRIPLQIFFIVWIYFFSIRSLS